jgi:hypothetical protein
MKRIKFSEAQILAALQEQGQGIKVAGYWAGFFEQVKNRVFTFNLTEKTHEANQIQ